MALHTNCTVRLLTPTDGHKTVTYDLSDGVTGAKDLEREIRDLLDQGATVFVRGLPGIEGDQAVVGFDAARLAWITRLDQSLPVPVGSSTQVTPVKPLAGG